MIIEINSRYGPKEVIFDDADLVTLFNRRWNISKYRGCFYALSNKYPMAGLPKIFMHQLILPAPHKGLMVDHINGNGLDNRRSNLRLVTHAQNAMNSRKREPLRHKGVSRSASELNPWQAKITLNGKGVYLGLYKTQDDAARAYDAEALKHFGEFARLNFPSGQDQL